MTDTVKNEIMEKLNKRFDDKVINMTEVRKNNGVKYTGVTIRKPEECIAPVIYIDSLCYGDVDEVVDKIACIYNNSNHIIDFAPVRYFEDVVDCLGVKLINKALNIDILDKCIHTDFLDLCIIPIVMLDNISGTISVTPELLRMWDKTAEEVIDISLRNNRKEKTCIKDVNELLPPIDIQELGMYVMTNEDKLYGANRMLDESALYRFANYLDKDLVIIPSSIHECIILPKLEGISTDYINEMIVSVNETMLDSEDVLSDHFYIFGKETGWN